MRTLLERLGDALAFLFMLGTIAALVAMLHMVGPDGRTEHCYPYSTSTGQVRC